jgi:hypothetical protein
MSTLAVALLSGGLESPGRIPPQLRAALEEVIDMSKSDSSG